MSAEKRNRWLDAPDEVLRDVLSELENQQGEEWKTFYKQLEEKDLSELNQMSLAIAMRVLELSQQDPDKAIKYFRDQQIMPVPRFLPNSDLSRFGDFFKQIMEELEWGEGLKEVRGDEGKLLNVLVEVTKTAPLEKLVWASRKDPDNEIKTIHHRTKDPHPAGC